jgi:probable rRNA maturation factor
MDLIVRNLQSKASISARLIKKTIRSTLESEGIKKQGRITVCFVNDRKIKRLNKLFLKKNNATDVLSFNLSENHREIFADIAISTESALENALAFHTSGRYEIILYVIHGVLHALGYADRTKTQKTIMRRKEEAIINKLIHAHR